MLEGMGMQELSLVLCRKLRPKQAPNDLSSAIGNTPACEVVGRQFDCDAVARENLMKNFLIFPDTCANTLWRCLTLHETLHSEVARRPYLRH